MQTEEPCLVCGTPTDMVCTGCNLRYYCSHECQAADRTYHLSECQSQQIGAFWGIGKWKSVVSEHANLIASQSENIALHGADSPNLHNTYDKLELNVASWKKGRSTTSRLLQDHVRTFNTALKEHSDALFLNKQGEFAALNSAIIQSAQRLAEFFADNLMFGSSFNARRDYENAFKIYAECLQLHSIYADKYVRSKDTGDEKSRMAQRRKCDRAADALGAVLNGRPWKSPS